MHGGKRMWLTTVSSETISNTSFGWTLSRGELPAASRPRPLGLAEASRPSQPTATSERPPGLVRNPTLSRTSLSAAGSGLMNRDGEESLMADSMIQGGCFCNSVRYTLKGSLQNARACHCSRCRKAFSGASSAYAELSPSSSFEWLKGEDLLSIHETGSGWGMGFCSKCGSTLCGDSQRKNPWPDIGVRRRRPRCRDRDAHIRRLEGAVGPHRGRSTTVCRTCTAR